MGKRALPAKKGDCDSESEAKELPNWVTPELIAETHEVWEPWYKRTLSRDSAIEILLNTGRLINLVEGKGRAVA
jgi:hypothetical protein